MRQSVMQKTIGFTLIKPLANFTVCATDYLKARKGIRADCAIGEII